MKSRGSLVVPQDYLNGQPLSRSSTSNIGTSPERMKSVEEGRTAVRSQMSSSILASMASLDIADVNEVRHREYQKRMQEEVTMQIIKDPSLNDKTRLERINDTQGGAYLFNRVKHIMHRLSQSSKKPKSKPDSYDFAPKGSEAIQNLKSFFSTKQDKRNKIFNKQSVSTDIGLQHPQKQQQPPKQSEQQQPPPPPPQKYRQQRTSTHNSKSISTKESLNQIKEESPLSPTSLFPSEDDLDMSYESNNEADNLDDDNNYDDYDNSDDDTEEDAGGTRTKAQFLDRCWQHIQSKRHEIESNRLFGESSTLKSPWDNLLSSTSTKTDPSSQRKTSYKFVEEVEAQYGQLIRANALIQPPADDNTLKRLNQNDMMYQQQLLLRKGIEDHRKQFINNSQTMKITVTSHNEKVYDHHHQDTTNISQTKPSSDSSQRTRTTQPPPQTRQEVSPLTPRFHEKKEKIKQIIGNFNSSSGSSRNSTSTSASHQSIDRKPSASLIRLKTEGMESSINSARRLSLKSFFPKVFQEIPEEAVKLQPNHLTKRPPPLIPTRRPPLEEATSPETRMVTRSTSIIINSNSPMRNPKKSMQLSLLSHRKTSGAMLLSPISKGASGGGMMITEIDEVLSPIQPSGSSSPSPINRYDLSHQKTHSLQQKHTQLFVQHPSQHFKSLSELPVGDIQSPKRNKRIFGSMIAIAELQVMQNLDRKRGEEKLENILQRISKFKQQSSVDKQQLIKKIKRFNAEQRKKNPKEEDQLETINNCFGSLSKVLNKFQPPPTLDVPSKSQSQQQQ